MAVKIWPYIKLILGAGTATANTAPLKFIAGTNLTTPEAGAIEYDGKSFFMTRTSTRRKVQLSNDTITASTTVANTVTETTIFTGTIPANAVSVGDVLRFTDLGYYSTVNGADTFTMRFKIGATTILTITSSAANVTNVPWHGNFTATVRSIGAGGTLFAFAEHDTNGVNKDAANTATTAIDTTATMTFTVTVQWSAADAGNTITLAQGFTEVL